MKVLLENKKKLPGQVQMNLKHFVFKSQHLTLSVRQKKKKKK